MSAVWGEAKQYVSYLEPVEPNTHKFCDYVRKLSDPQSYTVSSVQAFRLHCFKMNATNFQRLCKTHMDDIENSALQFTKKMKQTGDEEKLGELVWLLTFLNFRFRPNSKATELLKVMCNQIEAGSIPILAKVMRLLRLTMEIEDDVMDNSAKCGFLSTIFPSICRRLAHWKTMFEDLSQDSVYAVSTIFTLLMAGSKWSDKLRPYIEGIISSVISLLDYQNPPNTKVCQRVMINSMKVKALLAWFSFGCAAHRIFNKPLTEGNKITVMLLELLKETPMSFVTLIEEIINALSVVVKHEVPGDVMPSNIVQERLPGLLDISLCHMDVAMLLTNLLTMCYDKRNRDETLPDSEKERRYLYTMNLFHSQLPPSQLGKRVMNLQSVWRALSDKNVMKRLFVVSCFSTKLAISECHRSLDVRMDVPRSFQQIKELMATISVVGDKCLKCQRFLSLFLSQIPCHEANTFSKCFCSDFELTYWKTFEDALTSWFLFLIRYRSLLEECLPIVEEFRPKPVPGKYYERLGRHMRLLETYDNALKLHGVMVSESANLLNTLRYNIAVNVWDRIFNMVFLDKHEKFVLFSSTFSQLVGSPARFMPFIDGLLGRMRENFLNEERLGKVLRVRDFLQSMSTHEYEWELPHDVIQKVTELGKDVVVMSKSCLASPKYGDGAISMIMSLCLFLDKVMKNNGFSKFILKESYVAELFRLLAMGKIFTRSVIQFAFFCITTNPELIRVPFLMDTFFSATCNELDLVLPILRTLKKQKKDILFSHPSIRKFYQTLLMGLKEMKPELKPIAMKFLKHIPLRACPEFWETWEELTSKQTCTIVANGSELTVDTMELVNALENSLVCPESVDLVCRIYEYMIRGIVKSNCWNVKRRKAVMGIFAGVLQIADKEKMKATFSSLLSQTGLHLQLYVCAFCALCSNSNSPDFYLSYCLALYCRNDQSTTDFMMELLLMFCDQLVVSRLIRARIMTTFLQNISGDLLDSMVYALLVLRTVGGITHGFRDPEESDFELRIPELGSLSVNDKTLVIRGRQLLKEKPQSLRMLMSEFTVSAGLSHLLVMAEMMAWCECDEEVMEFVDIHLNSDTLEISTKARLLGIWFRAFPDALSKRLEQVHELVKTALSQARVYQIKDLSLFLALVESKSAFPESIISECIDQVVPLYRSPNLILQRQCMALVSSVVRSGNANHIQKLSKCFQNIFLNANIRNDITPQVWWDLQSGAAVLRCCFLITPAAAVDMTVRYLGHLAQDFDALVLPNGVTPNDCNNVIDDLFHFIASDTVLTVLRSQRLMNRLFLAMVRFFMNCPMIRTTIANSVRTIVYNAIASFVEFVVSPEIQNEPPHFWTTVFWMVDDMFAGPTVQGAEFPAGFIPDSFDVDVIVLKTAKLLIAWRFGYDVRRMIGPLMQAYLRIFSSNPSVMVPYLFMRLVDVFAELDTATFVSLAGYVSETKQPIFVGSFYRAFVSRLEAINLDVLKRVHLPSHIDSRIVFFQRFVVAYLVNQPKDLNQVIQWVKDTQSVQVFASFLRVLREKSIEFSESLNELFDRATSDEDIFELIHFWSKNPDADVFSRVISAGTQYIQLHMPQCVSDTLATMKIPDGQTISDDFFSRFDSFIKHNNALHILANVAGQVPTQVPPSCWCTITDYMESLDSQLLTQKVSILQLLQPLHAMTSIIPSDDQIEPDENALLCCQHITFFVERCLSMAQTNYDQLMKLGFWFSTTCSKMANLFGTTWPCASKLIDIYIETVKEKGGSPFLQYAMELISCLVIAAVYGSTFDKVEDYFTFFNSAIGKRYGFMFAQNLYHFAISPQHNHLFKAKLNTYFTTPECLAIVFPALWFSFPNESYEHLRQILDCCVDQAKDPRGCTAVVLYFLFRFPRDKAIAFLLDKMKICASKLEDPNNSAFLTTAIRLGLGKGVDKSIRSLVFQIVADKRVNEVCFNRIPVFPSERMITEMPIDVCFASLPQILKKCPGVYSRLSQMSKSSWVTSLAKVFNATLREVFPIARFLTHGFAVPVAESHGVNLTFNDDVTAYITTRDLESWDDVDEIAPEFCDARNSVIPSTTLLLRMGFRERAVQTLNNPAILDSLEFTDIKETIQPNLMFFDQGISIVLRNMDYPQQLHAELADFLQFVTSQTTSQDFVDFMILRQLKYAPKFLLGQDMSRSHPFLISIPEVESPTRVSALLKVLQTITCVLQGTKSLPAHVTAIEQKIKEVGIVYKNSLAMHSGFELDNECPSRQWDEAITVAFSDTNDERVRRVAVAALIDGLKRHSDSDVIWSSLLKYIPSLTSNSAEVTSVVTKIPFHWSQVFVKAVIANPHMHKLLTAADQAFQLDGAGFADAPPAFKVSVSRLLEPLEELVQDDLVQALKDNAEAEMKLATEFESETLTSHPVSVVETSSAALITKTCYIMPANPPLVRVPGQTKAVRICGYRDHPKQRCLFLSLLLSNGCEERYSISGGSSASDRFSVFCSIVSRLMDQMPECVARRQRIPVGYSTTIPGGFTLTALGKGRPLALKSYLGKMIRLRTNAVSSGERNVGGLVYSDEGSGKRFAFETKESVCCWLARFAARYSAISMMTVCASASPPSPYAFIFDVENAGLSLIDLVTRPGREQVIRVGGQLCPLCQELFLRGPFKIGLITAAQCLAANARRIRFHINALLELVNADEFVETAAQFSVRMSSIDDVQNRVNELIARSEERRTWYAALPWI